MATGLPTFDSFSWSSLLKGRRTLVADRELPRARRMAAALEEAGAVVTLAPNQAAAADRARDQRFSLAVLGLSGNEQVAVRLSESLACPGTLLVLLAETARHGELRGLFPRARLGDHTMGDRDLVMFVLGTPDE